jgi:hypothetical protein
MGYRLRGPDALPGDGLTYLYNQQRVVHLDQTNTLCKPPPKLYHIARLYHSSSSNATTHPYGA